MAFNNFYSNPYQTYTPAPFQPQIPQNQPNNGIIWVSGLAGAKAYMVAPNSTVQLWDSEAQCVYLKSADASGMPSIKILDYTIRDQNPPQAPLSQPVGEYATKQDLSALRAELEQIKARLGGAHNEPAVQRDAK